jgi:hypothetical protein
MKTNGRAFLILKEETESTSRGLSGVGQARPQSTEATADLA